MHLDWLVVTAANRAQARGYSAQLRARERDGRLAMCRNWLVVPDPGDQRIGSGGSTVVVLDELARRLKRGHSPKNNASIFHGKRILIIHSGGDSRRLPAYAAEGKVFVPLPRRSSHGQPAALFDLVLADLAAIPIPDEGRIVIATGDVLLGIGRHRPDIGHPGMVGVAFPGAASVGARHGVYVAGARGAVGGFLQKPSPRTAREHRAMDRRGRVLIDTGVLALDPRTAALFLASARSVLQNIRLGRAPSIDLYSDILPRIAGPGVSRDRRGDGAASAIARSLSGVPFHLAIVPSCDFLHIGSTRELLALTTRDPRLRDSPASRGATIYNSVHDSIRGGGRSLIESSRLSASATLAGNNIVVGCPGGVRMSLARNIGVAFLPIGKRDWACIAFDVNDDFKATALNGGKLCGHPLSVFQKPESSLFANDVDGSAWAARVWTVGTVQSTAANAMAIARGAAAPSSAARRWSLQELIPRVDHARLIEHRAALRSETQVLAWQEDLKRGIAPSAYDIAAMGMSVRDASHLRRAFARALRLPSAPFVRARLHRSAAVVPGTLARDALKHDLDAFRCVAEGVSRHVPINADPPAAAIRRDEVVWVTSPVRIDLAGGWSDTPPICNELGGSVVNAAITLNHQYPVQVIARLTDTPSIRLSSVDLGHHVDITTTAEARSFNDPADWAALPKAALALAGIVPSRRDEPLARVLKRFGGGLDITMFAALPKGSGLGTSSILGAAVLACIDRVCGRGLDLPSLIQRTSLLEQLMSTAGGWQDQVGGITPGIKLLRTRAGQDQVPELFRISPPARALAELRARSLLYYTGQRRLARDILHGVVRRYLSQDPGVIEIIHQLKATAENMRADLVRGDVDAFARGVLRNWTLKKAIDPGSTNARIEAMLAPLAPHLTGFELPGAGGGGFIYMIATSEAHAARVRSMLTRHPANPLARFYDSLIDETGIAVSVL